MRVSPPPGISRATLGRNLLTRVKVRIAIRCYPITFQWEGLAMKTTALLLLSFSLAATTGGFAETTYVSPDYAGGYIVEEPGGGTTYISPDYSGGYIIDQPDDDFCSDDW